MSLAVNFIFTLILTHTKKFLVKTDPVYSVETTAMQFVGGQPQRKDREVIVRSSRPPQWQRTVKRLPTGKSAKLHIL